MKRLVLYAGTFLLSSLLPLSAQLNPPNQKGVSLGQIHSIVRNLEASKKFWMVMGGKAIRVDGIDVMKFPGVLVFLEHGEPTGGTEGSAIDHVGFWVRGDGIELVHKLEAVGAKLGDGAGVRNPIIPMVGYVYTPDGLRIEIMEARMPLVEARMERPQSERVAALLKTSNAVFDHLHLAMVGPSAKANSWYIDTFGARPFTLDDRNGGAGEMGNLAGARILWAKSQSEPAATRGRAVDHIGFEVKNLESFCKTLATMGIKFDAPFSTSRHKSFASAELTDPWGRSIELTEGLSRF